MSPNERKSLVQRLMEAVRNPHHVQPLSESMVKLLEEVSQAILKPVLDEEVLKRAYWEYDHLVKAQPKPGSLERAFITAVHIANGQVKSEVPDYKAWYEEAMAEANNQGYAGMSVVEVLRYQGKALEDHRP